ncbi:YfbU family protein [Citrobacter freundii]|uniref:YfbU family protein n=1 Tax=Citrobacter freundii TaxID=546 RepID=UPI0025CA7B14|nr:YfbU family protein [Citrobacter freundii]MDN4292767.1 YfbU family protein [Citrobacter freundii]
MKYTQPEKLQLMMLCEIYRALEIENSFDPDILEEAISTDNTWAIDWQYQSLDSGEDTPPEVKLFVDTVDMYGILKYTYGHFSDSEKADVESAVSHFSADHCLEFPGFDGNNEGEYLTIGRLLTKMGRFSESGDITKNSHIPSVEIYQRMLEEFLPARAKEWCHGRGITKEAFIRTLNARVHPENR